MFDTKEEKTTAGFAAIMYILIILFMYGVGCLSGCAYPILDQLNNNQPVVTDQK